MIQGCYKCGGKIHETGGTASNVEGMSQEQQMLMMIASTLQDNISKHGQEEGVQMTLQLLAERGLIDATSEEGMQQGISLLEASINYVDEAYGGRNISQEGLPQYTSGGYDDMEQGGKIPDNVLRSRLEAHMSPSEADAYLDSYKKGGYTVTRSSDRKGKTHKVVRNSDGKTEYYGYPGMGEKSKSKYGKEAFYARHAQNIKNNPFFAAYARATWAEGGETDMYKQGGRKMVKRADGSYSPWGLWDSIRANRGSGKEPTKEMLEQERKLKKAQFAGEQKENFVEVENPPAYTTVHSGIGAVQLKDEKDAKRQQRWLNTMAFANTPTMSGNENLAGWGSLIRGIAGASTIPRTISNTIRGFRTHQAQAYDASGNKLGDPQYIEHSDWKDMQKERRTIARNQRREDRMLRKEDGGEWNPFEDNRPKVRMNIHKPMFVEGGEPFPTFDEWRRTPEGSQLIISNPVANPQDLYNKAKADWEAQQSPVVKETQIPEVGASNNPVSENSSITNQNQSNTPQANGSNFQPYTQYGTDNYNTLGAATSSGVLSNLNFGLSNVVTSGYDQRNNLSQNIQTYGTMGQKASNPQDPRMGGPLAAEFSNVGFTGNDPGAAKWYSANAGDKGMSTFFGKNGGQMYEVGGEYDLTDEELMMLKSIGYEYEALRK